MNANRGLRAGLLSCGIVLLLTVRAFGQPCDSVDQECEYYQYGFTCYNVDSHFPVMQSFTPLLSWLCGVELVLGPTHDTSDITVRIQTSPVPYEGVVGSVTRTIEWQATDWIYFALPGVTLTPGATYYIFPTDDHGFLWCSGHPYCAYPGGSAYADGSPIEWDWCFRTYGDAATPATTMTWSALKSRYR